MSGLALIEKISNNHSTWNLDHLKTTWGNTEGSHLWEEVRDRGDGGGTFLLNITSALDKQITNVFAEDFKQAHVQLIILGIELW